MSSAVSWFLLSALFFIIISYFAVCVNIFYTIITIAICFINWNLTISFFSQVAYSYILD